MEESEAYRKKGRFCEDVEDNISLRQYLGKTPGLVGKVRKIASSTDCMLMKICREMDNHHKVELARSTQQTSAASQLLRQNNGILIDINNCLGAVRSGLTRQEAERGTEITLIQNSHQAVDCLGVRLNDLASMSQGQNETLLEKFEHMQSQIEELKALHSQAPTADSSTVKISEQLGEEEQISNLADKHRIMELSEGIKRLCSLASEPRKIAFSPEAQRIISDIEKILTFISESSKFTEADESRERNSDQIVDLEFSEASRKSQLRLDIGKMRGLLESSERVSVNQPGLSYLDPIKFQDSDSLLILL